MVLEYEGQQLRDSHRLLSAAQAHLGISVERREARMVRKVIYLIKYFFEFFCTVSDVGFLLQGARCGESDVGWEGFSNELSLCNAWLIHHRSLIVCIIYYI